MLSSLSLSALGLTLMRTSSKIALSQSLTLGSSQMPLLHFLVASPVDISITNCIFYKYMITFGMDTQGLDALGYHGRPKMFH